MNEEQNMDFDFGSAIEKIQEMMGTDDGQSKLNNIINAFVGSDEDNANSQEQDSPFPDMDQMDMMIKLGKCYVCDEDHRQQQKCGSALRFKAVPA
ncbi:MAG: hypothetical protein V8T08_02960 [Monoglobus pectinilyticus]|uniref:hypothetical protein n=1 Tax=Monoglobus pectinilyticus TaxID=1981510 RepID=UPI00300F2EAE